MPSTMPRNKMIDKGGMREQRWAKTSRKQQRRQEVAVDHMPSMIRKQSRHPTGYVGLSRVNLLQL